MENIPVNTVLPAVNPAVKSEEEDITDLYLHFFEMAVLYPEGERTEDLLRKQKIRLQEQSELIELAEDIIMVLDMDFRISFWNHGAEKKYGWPRSQVIGQVTHDLLQTQFPRPIEEIYAELYEHGFWAGELRQLTRNQTPIIVESRWSLRRDLEGNPTAVLQISNDITKRKEAEELLQKTLADLENRIQERTVDLTRLNAELAQEVEERRRMEEVLKKREKELEVKSRNLEELNTALTVLLKKREEDKNQLEERVLTNVKEMVLPYMDKLKTTHLGAEQSAYLSILESHLNDIISPFLVKMSAKYRRFTPKEIQVATLVKDGKSTKEIANIMNVCTGAVELHRNHIRNKLCLTNKKMNLRSYLLSLP
ncbi:MAG: PAS domain S-box protein [Syntrophaceae bacterium]|nr:PAS domain S-box protein [Syntrophaceae bacterium]